MNSYMGLNARKPVFGVLLITQVQTSLRIHAVWSAPFFIHFLESTICKLATGEIFIFYLVSVAEVTGLKLALSETPKTGFLAIRPILWSFIYRKYFPYFKVNIIPLCRLETPKWVCLWKIKTHMKRQRTSISSVFTVCLDKIKFQGKKYGKYCISSYSKK